MLKKIMAVSVLGVSAFGMVAANATTDGIYVVGQAGYADTHMKNKMIPTDPFEGSGFSMPNRGFGGRLAVGYQFNPNLAVEMGYLKLLNQSSRFKLAPHSAYLAAKETLQQNAIDLVAKGILPITDKFNAYGKLGAAYLTSTIACQDDVTGKVSNDNRFFGIAKHTFAPEVGLGVTYNITSNIFVDTSWTHIRPIGKNKPGNIDFAAIGIGYSFG